MNTTQTSGEVIRIQRIFDAPAEKVWRAWTDPGQLMRWWGPANFSSPAAKIDLRVGGTYLFCMQGPDGKDYWSTGTYQEIEPLDRLVFTDSFADASGKVVPASHYGMGDEWPEALLVTLTFEDRNGKTAFSVNQAGVPGGMLECCTQGWNESLDKLARVVAA